MYELSPPSTSVLVILAKLLPANLVPAKLVPAFAGSRERGAGIQQCVIPASQESSAPLCLPPFVPLRLSSFVPLCLPSVPLCLSSCLGASYRLSVPSRVSFAHLRLSSFVPLCLCAFVPSLSAFVPLCLSSRLCAFPQCLAGKCPSRLDQESSVLRMSFLAQ